MGVKQSKLPLSHLKVEEATGLSKVKTVPDCLQYHSMCTPYKEAVVFVSADGSREPVTFLKLYDASFQAARALLALGVKRKECIAINMRPCPEWLYITFGAIMAGARPIGVSFTYKDGSDLIALMEKVQNCSAIVLDPGLDEENWEIFSKHIDTYSPDGSMESSRMPSLRHLICHDRPKNETNVMTLNELLTNLSDDIELPTTNEDDITMLFQTSGSTGFPKLAAHTNRSLVSLSKLAYRIGDRTFSDRPFQWVGGFPVQIFYGKTRIALSGISPPPADRISFMIDVIRSEHCDALVALPPTLHELLLEKDELIGNWPLKTILTGGQPITENAMTCIGSICSTVAVGYAGTEFLMSNINFISHPNDFTEYCVGYPVPGTEIKVVDSDGDIVPINKSGEIYFRGRGVFKEYYNDPEKTRAVLTEDGWFKTDDIGQMFEDGALVVEGRKSNMIICGAMNVTPEILEQVIAKCPGVDYAVLVPVPDEVMYQEICACVKLIPESALTVEDIRKFCEGVHGDKLGLFTVLPKYYMILDKFPVTFTGKISRKVVTEMAINMFGK